MVATISLNPIVTTNAAGTFNVTSDGYIQGTALADPSARNWLSGGVLGPNETKPMWGGVAINETTTPVATSGSFPNQAQGGYITRATTVTSTSAGAITGFSVFDQDHSMINTPQSPVPLAASGMGVNFYRLGSNARIAVLCDPALAAQGVSIQTQYSWDFTLQMLIPYSAAYAANTITNAVWASTGGGRTTYTVSADPTSFIDAGDDIEVTGVVNTGGASTSAFNGQWKVVSVTSSTIVVAAPAAASIGTYASGGSVAAGGGAVPVKVLDIQVGNCMTVLYDAVTGFATWNRNGSCAIIQL